MLLAQYISVGVLAVTAAFDLILKKVPGGVIAGLAALSLAIMLSLFQSHGLERALLGALVGACLYLPLMWLKVVSLSDVKLLALAGLSAGPFGTFMIGVWALVWGSVLGMVMVTAAGDLKLLGRNLLMLVKFQKPSSTSLHRVPFATALFLGAVTQWILVGSGAGI